MQPVYLALGILICIWLLRKIWGVRNAYLSFQYLPVGSRYLLPPFGGNEYLPKIPFITPGNNSFFRGKHSPFAKAGWDIVLTFSAFPKPAVRLLLADADVIKEVTTSRARFPKPVELYKVLSFYGSNIVASEGEEWKKTRKISSPAFSDRNNRLVWDETTRTVNELHHDVWGPDDVITIDNFLDITLRVALLVIAAAGFGRRLSWQDDEVLSASHKISFNQALYIMCTDVFLKLLLPGRALGFTQRTRNLKMAYQELRFYILEMIVERQKSEKVERSDLLSNLLEANASDLEVTSLTETELMGNIYIFLLAGHETTAHTLGFAFGLLALHPDEQEKLYQHILSVLPDGRLPTYEDMPKLTHCLAVFNESLRMFPSVVEIPKRSQEDTTFVTRNTKGESLTIPVPKGTRIAIHTPGLHYNPRYWKNPHKFDPSRFLKDWPRDAFLPFSAGPRACLGRKFAETEAIVVLTLMILRYKVTVKEEAKFAGETFEQRKERVLRSKNILTLTPIRLPLQFTKRKNGYS